MSECRRSWNWLMSSCRTSVQEISRIRLFSTSTSTCFSTLGWVLTIYARDWLKPWWSIKMLMLHSHHLGRLDSPLSFLFKFPRLCPSLSDPRSSHHAAHLHEQLPAVQWDQRASGAALCPLHGDSRPTRPVPQVLADHREGREQVHQEVSGYCHGRGDKSVQQKKAVLFHCKPIVERYLIEKQYDDDSFDVGKT